VSRSPKITGAQRVSTSVHEGTHEWVKKDIAAYKPKLKSNGWLTGHDIDFPGVNRAVNEIVKKYDIGPNNVWLTQYT
jgi:hypothetical protein